MRTERDMTADEIASRRSSLQQHFKGQPPILGGHALWSALGFQSCEAFRQARRRGQVEVNLMRLSGRRGTFAFTTDVIEWLSKAGSLISGGTPLPYDADDLAILKDRTSSGTGGEV